MTNKEAKRQIFMEAHAKWLANQEKHYGYNENAGKYQDDLNEIRRSITATTRTLESIRTTSTRWFGQTGISLKPTKNSGEITPCTSKKVSTPTKQS